MFHKLLDSFIIIGSCVCVFNSGVTVMIIHCVFFFLFWGFFLLFFLFEWPLYPLVGLFMLFFAVFFGFVVLLRGGCARLD